MGDCKTKCEWNFNKVRKCYLLKRLDPFSWDLNWTLVFFFHQVFFSPFFMSNQNHSMPKEFPSYFLNTCILIPCINFRFLLSIGSSVPPLLLQFSMCVLILSLIPSPPFILVTCLPPSWPALKPHYCLHQESLSQCSPSHPSFYKSIFFLRFSFVSFPPFLLRHPPPPPPRPTDFFLFSVFPWLTIPLSFVQFSLPPFFPLFRFLSSSFNRWPTFHFVFADGHKRD